jgi:hypothetical protein
MGTHSLTIFKDEDGGEIAVMYRQFDGYLTGHGKELRDFLAGRLVVNGFTGEDKEAGNFNGMSCLAAAVVGKFKEGIGNIYLHSAGTRDVGEDYTYTVRPGPETVSTSSPYPRKIRGILFEVSNYNGEFFKGPVEELDIEAVEKALTTLADA